MDNILLNSLEFLLFHSDDVRLEKLLKLLLESIYFIF